MKNVLIRLSNVSKSYQGKKIVNNVSLSLYAQEVHVMASDNSYAKDMLIELILGNELVEDGNIYIEEEKFPPLELRRNLKSRIAVVRSGEDVIDNLNVAENIFLLNGNSFEKQWLSPRYMRIKTLQLLRQLGINELDPKAKVEKLSALERKLVIITRAISSGAELIILDDITSNLNKQGAARILQFVKQLKAMGLSVLYITSQINEVLEIADQLSIMRNYSIIDTADIAGSSEETVHVMMWGGKIKNTYQEIASAEKYEILKVNDLKLQGLNGITFSLKSGGVTWVSGLSRAGEKEFGDTLFGLKKKSSIQVCIDHEMVNIKSPYDAVSHHIVYIPEMRLDHLLLAEQNAEENICLGAINKIKKLGVINLRLKHFIYEECKQQLLMRKEVKEEPVKNLDTSDKYKVVIGRALAMNPKVLILSLPITWIGSEAFEQIMQHLRKLCERGLAVMLLSNELEGTIDYIDDIILIEACIGKNVTVKNLTREEYIKDNN